MLIVTEDGGSLIETGNLQGIFVDMTKLDSGSWCLVCFGIDGKKYWITDPNIDTNREDIMKLFEKITLEMTAGFTPAFRVSEHLKRTPFIPPMVNVVDDGGAIIVDAVAEEVAE